MSNTGWSQAAPGMNVSKALQLLETDVSLKEPHVSRTPDRAETTEGCCTLADTPPSDARRTEDSTDFSATNF